MTTRWRRGLIVLACLAGGAVWVAAMLNVLLVGIAGCESPYCGESELVFLGPLVAAMAALTIAIGGIVVAPATEDGRTIGYVAIAAMCVAMVLTILGSGLGLLLALCAYVVFGLSVVRAKAYPSGPAITLVVASVGHVIGYGLLLFPFAWLWFAIAVARGPRLAAIA